MRTFVSAALISGWVGIFGCQSTPDSTARLLLTAPDDARTTLSIGTMNLVDYSTDTLGSIELDSLGKGLLILELDRPASAFILHPNRSGQLYLAPGYDLQVSFESSGEGPGVQFQGHGSAVNNYLNEVSQLEQDRLYSRGKSYWELNADELLARLDSVKIAFLDFH